jgi:serine/threonine kinase 16
MREVDAYRLFDHVPTIISAYDHCVATDRGSGGGGDDDASKTVYVLLPYYRRGNLQDMINANLVNHGRFPERHLMMLFLGVCKALRAMHEYQPAPAERMQMGREEDQDHDDTTAGAASGGSRSGRKMGTRGKRTEEQEQGEQERPLMEQGSRLEGESGGKIKSYAHRDIKPGKSPPHKPEEEGGEGEEREKDKANSHRFIQKTGNIMIDDSGSIPILMDLGSVAPSPIPVTSQSLALQIQDQAAEHSTMPYRAPELFDVRTGSVIDTKTDIWSLGCTLYACLVGKSPFELRSDETGGTLSLCVLGGDWRFPDENPGGGKAKRTNTIQAAKAKASAAAGESGGPGGGSSGDVAISEPIRNLVRACLKVEPAERPDINELITMVEQVIDELPEGDFTS